MKGHPQRVQVRRLGKDESAPDPGADLLRLGEQLRPSALRPRPPLVGRSVQPDSNGDVRVVLHVTTNCDDESAICTEDGRMLSSELDFTVSGP